MTDLNRNLVLCLLLGMSVSGCANTAWGQRLGQSLSIPSPIAEIPGRGNPPVVAPSNSNSPLVMPSNSPGVAQSNPSVVAPSNSPAPSPSDPNPEASQTPNPLSSGTATSGPSSPAQPTAASNSSIPDSLKATIQTVLNLGVIQVASHSPGVWDQPVSRRTFARWLFEVNNRLYSDRPGQQIRLSSATAKPVFQDIPTSDPDFTVIQGLAEAGILPSPLRGNASLTQFRPDAPLTREQMVLWKVPLDAHQSLPTATIDRIAQTWNFQDGSQISGEALGSVLLDFQNGDLSNIRRVFGYTTLFQPRKSVSQAEAIVALSYFGFQGQGVEARNAPAITPSPSPLP